MLLTPQFTIALSHITHSAEQGRLLLCHPKQKQLVPGGCSTALGGSSQSMSPYQWQQHLEAGEHEKRTGCLPPAPKQPATETLGVGPSEQAGGKTDAN